MRTHRSADGVEWGVQVTLPGSSNAMVVFRHPDGATSRFDRYNWFISSAPEARSVTSRLSPERVMTQIDDVALGRLFSRSMPVSRPAIEPNLAAVYNLDPGPQSRDLLHAFENTDYFWIVRYVGSDEELNKSIVTGRVKVGIKIPPDYSDRLLTGRQATVLVLIDGSDSSIATQSLQVASQVGLTESLERLTTALQSSQGRTSQLPIEVRPKMLFNPDSRSANFMVPGLIAVILQIITTLLTAFSVVRERERGTLEQLLVTPVRPFGLMLGKLVPYGLIGIVETLTVLTVMRLVFDVPINGSLLLLLSLSILFLFTALAIGLLISTKAQSQMQALQLAWLIMLPSVLLSGFMFPRDSMPVIMRVIGYLVPATHFMEIIRGIVLRGATLIDLLPEVLTLIGMGLVLLALSAFRFRKKLA